MSHFKANMHQIRLLVSVSLSVCPWTIGESDKWMCPLVRYLEFDTLTLKTIP